MRKDHEQIEEKLIPYLEGVLNAKERREVEEAIHSDGELAREMSDLRDIILELRQGFASGLKPPQEELTVEEVVELGANTGSVETLPGSSQQKARLFCSDQALEEYSLLRALQEEMARTTLDRENIPEMPAALRKEFQALQQAPGGGRKVLPFKKEALSPIPLWHRASRLLDRVDPKPLMASAAALVMLSLGVHFYQNPRGAAGGEQAEIGYNFSEQQAAASATPLPGTAAQESATPASVASSGVAVFTSDDRGLLKEQAEKLLANKVRYTVTKDRILVAEKDVKMARDILWADQDGKAVAMAKETPPSQRMTRPDGSAGAALASDSQPQSEGSTNYYAAEPASAHSAARSEAAADSGMDDVMYSPPRRAAAPAPPPPPQPNVTYQPLPGAAATGGRVMASDPDPYDRRAEREAKSTVIASKAPERSTPRSDEGAVKPTVVDFSTAAGPAPRDESPAPMPQTVHVRPPAPTASGSSPSSTARRNKLRQMAMGDGSDLAPEEGAPVPAPVAAAPATSASASSQQTVIQTRARVAQEAPSAAASAPMPNVVRASETVPQDSEESEADGRLARLETSRQEVANKHGVELSFNAKNGKIEVYVRPKKALTKADLDELRKTLRKELGLADSDTIIFR